VQSNDRNCFDNLSHKIDKYYAHGHPPQFATVAKTDSPSQSFIVDAPPFDIVDKSTLSNEFLKWSDSFDIVNPLVALVV